MIGVHVMTATRGTIRVEHALFREWLIYTEKRFKLALGYVSGYPCASAKNKIVLNFLADRAADYLLMIDDDQLPTNNPLDYIEYDKDILGWPYPSSRTSNERPITWYPKEPEPETPMVRAEIVGGGGLLIARRVLEHPAMKAPFIDLFDENGLFKVGEDYNFCKRATEAGFRVWCALDSPLLHIKPIELYTVWSAYNGNQNGASLQKVRN
jgi:hypothetical protein